MDAPDLSHPDNPDIQEVATRVPMTEEQRRLYLEAMGIPLWLPRNGDATQILEELALISDITIQNSQPSVAVALPTPPASHQTTATPISQATPIAGSPKPSPGFPVAALSAVLDGESTVLPSASLALIDLNWEELAAQIAQCQACQELVANRTRTVFGVGNRQARLLVIGEAPGAEEDHQGEPFVGRAGQILNAMLSAIGLKREEVYIANIVKCRPPNNRTPHQDEANRCEPWLLRQIDMLAPAFILALGQTAACNLLKIQITVGQMRKNVHQYGTRRIPLVVTYHPAYLLRSPGQKAEVWKDLQILARLLRQG